jgi:radical SAM/Cys-rich protein
MSRDTVQDLLAFMSAQGIAALDLTGGAPELNDHFRHLVREARALGAQVTDRCNLTVLLEPGQEELAEFLAEHEVEVVASLPCYLGENVDAQRGKGVFESSIRALRRLNGLGYGAPDSELRLHLVYNPQGPVLPPPQDGLEADYKRCLAERYEVRFNRLYTLTNMPIKRFGSMLLSKGQFQDYLALLREAHCPDNLGGVMCRGLVSVDWQGYLYDCDFNQMLGLPLAGGMLTRPHIRDMLHAEFEDRQIRVAEHCYGCTAGRGSSCGGALS